MEIQRRMALFLCGQSALRNAQGGGNGIRTDTDEYGRIRTGLWLSDSHALQKFKSTWHSVCHVLPSPYYSVHIRTYPYPSSLRYAAASKVPCQPTVHAAMRSRNSKVHGTQYAMYSPLRTTPYISVPIRTRLRFATPRQAKCLASQQYTQPCASEIPERTAHTAPCTHVCTCLYKSVFVRIPLPTVSALRYRRFESPIFSAFYLQKSTNGCIVL